MSSSSSSASGYSTSAPSASAANASSHEKMLFQQLLNNISFNKSIDDSNPGFSTNNIDKIRARFVEEALVAHNVCRAKHGVEPLTLNSEITIIAQCHADRLVEQKELVLSDSKYEGKSMGESLGFFYDKRVDSFTGLLILILS